MKYQENLIFWRQRKVRREEFRVKRRRIKTRRVRGTIFLRNNDSQAFRSYVLQLFILVFAIRSVTWIVLDIIRQQ